MPHFCFRTDASIYCKSGSLNLHGVLLVKFSKCFVGVNQDWHHPLRWRVCVPLLSKCKPLKAKPKWNFEHLSRICFACVILVAVAVTSYCGNSIQILQEKRRRR